MFWWCQLSARREGPKVDEIFISQLDRVYLFVSIYWLVTPSNKVDTIKLDILH
jgi:hypothetical protein